MALAHAAYLTAVILSAAPKEATVFVDKGDYFVRLGAGQGAKKGTQVRLLGEKIGDTAERRQIGTAEIMEVWPTISRVVPNLDEGKKWEQVAAAALGSAAPPPPAAAAEAKPAAAPAPAGKPVNAVVEFKSHNPANTEMHISCRGAVIDVQGSATLTGGRFTLLVGGKVADSQSANVGNTVNLKGSSNGKAVVFTVRQTVFASNYSMSVDGEPCHIDD